ncbi:MAG: SDR family oxidoreductase [Kutzneria sp.]|nr:SDR family oxidoreductase [Kutzneria sp.]
MRIDGAVALVTGANRGMGQALAQELVARGARTVYAAARDPERIADERVVPIRLDITDPDEVAEAAKRCADTTLLVNNAGIAYVAPLIGPPSLRRAREQMETNYFGTLSMCRAFAPVLRDNGGGAVVNMLSIVSFFSAPGMGSFCPTKAALWSLTNGLRMELREQGTLVVGVHASFIDTRMSEGIDGPKHPPADVAATILDAVAAGREEVLADEDTREMKAALPRDLELIYPRLESEYHAASG